MFLRHASRHVHHTVANYVKAGLDELGWTASSASQRPFGAAQFVVRTDVAISDRERKAISDGLVAVSLGNEAPPDPEELGGAIASQEYPIFVDVFSEVETHGLTCASDIRDHLLGRFEFSQRWLPVIDQSTATAVAGWRLELDDIERVYPDQPFPIHWQVVKVTAVAHFPEVIP